MTMIVDLQSAQALIFRESRLLDTGRFEEWLELFTKDAVYWLPIADSDPSEAAHAVSIVYDDRARMEERVFRTLHTPVLDQNPRSRMVHIVSNIEVDGLADSGDSKVLCAQLVAEMRPGGDGQIGLNQPTYYAARCEYRLRLIDDDWRIALKKVLLVNRDQALPNIAFLL